jgi:hypothetical protein
MLWSGYMRGMVWYRRGVRLFHKSFVTAALFVTIGWLAMGCGGGRECGDGYYDIGGVRLYDYMVSK